MNDEELADEIIYRLNRMVRDPDVAKDVGDLCNTRVPCSEATVNHPSIQVSGTTVGFLGILNGLVGTIPEGSRVGWGYIAAVYDRYPDGTMYLTGFERTKSNG